MRGFLPGLVRWSIHCGGRYLMGVNWDRGQKCKMQVLPVFTAHPYFLLCSLPEHFTPWVTVNVMLVPHTCAQVNPIWCLLPLKVADKLFVPKQDLSLLDEKWNIQEISSTGQQSSVKGKILTLEACNEMWVITMTEFVKLMLNYVNMAVQVHIYLLTVMIQCHYFFWVYICLFSVLLLLGFSGNYVNTKAFSFESGAEEFCLCHIHQEIMLPLLLKKPAIRANQLTHKSPQTHTNIKTSIGVLWVKHYR